MPRDSGRFIIPSPLLALNNGVIVGNSAGRLIRYDAAGEELWGIRRGGALSDLFAADPQLGVAMAVTHNSYDLSDTLLLLDHAGGAERWARPIEGARIVEGPAIAGGLIVVGVVSVREDERREPSLVAFTHDGKLAWRTPLLLTPRGIAGDNNGNLYISCSGVGNDAMGGVMVSFDPAGKKRWEVTLESGVPAPPAVSTDWVYFVARREGRTGIFTYSRDGVFRNFLSIHLYPDVLATITISSLGEILLSGMDVATVLRGG
jgi:outer membrane protein assembly factor BamB